MRHNDRPPLLPAVEGLELISRQIFDCRFFHCQWGACPARLCVWMIELFVPAVRADFEQEAPLVRIEEIILARPAGQTAA